MSEKSLKRKKHLLLFVIILFSILTFLTAVLLGAIGYLRLSVNEYYAYSEKSFYIPGINENLVPQGLEYDERTQSFFVGGYMSDNTASPVYIVDKNTGNTTKKVLLANSDGSAFTGHAGGIKVNGDYVYVAGGADHCLYVFSYSQITSAGNGASVKALGTFSTKSDNDYIRVSFLSEYNNCLIAGEFYNGGVYKTQASHKIITKAGDYNQGLAVAYKYSDAEGSVFGLMPTPVSAFCLPDKAQGMCIENGKAYLSTSYGLAFSQIHIYDVSKLARQDDLKVLDVTLPHYAFDSASLITSKKIAPMSEELVVVDNKLYIMCESACNKYIFGKLTSSQWCYASDISKMS